MPEDGINATPAARRLAEAEGVDLAAVAASGATGIVVGDVRAAIERALGGSVSFRAGAAPGGAYTFDAPELLGGVRVTVRPGEVVPPNLFAHVPEADRGLFSPLAPPPEAE